jgi:hypothetical protein
MKKLFFCIVFTFCFISFVFAKDLAIQKKQSYFLGTWYYEETDIYYTISNDRFDVFVPSDNTGFTVLISNWEYIINDSDNFDNYPYGFKITGKIKTMTGSWWIGVGDTDTWILYLHKNRNSFIIISGKSYDAIYIRQQ